MIVSFFLHVARRCAARTLKPALRQGQDAPCVLPFVMQMLMMLSSPAPPPPHALFSPSSSIDPCVFNTHMRKHTHLHTGTYRRVEGRHACVHTPMRIHIYAQNTHVHMIHTHINIHTHKWLSRSVSRLVDDDCLAAVSCIFGTGGCRAVSG